MKTLCLTLLLLSVWCCCDAMLKMNFNEDPESCCFSFSTRPLPSRLVSKIMMTHSHCVKPAFIVETVRGRQICYSLTLKWALAQHERINGYGRR